MNAATRLFATRSFHDVRLEDVAAAARVGKATVYVYFRSKQDLYLRLIREGFERLVVVVRRDVDERSEADAWDTMERIVRGLVEFATAFPLLFQLMRSGAIPADDEALLGHRRELVALIERTLRRGVRRGELRDAHPDLTAQFVISFVREALLHGPPVAGRVLTAHILQVLSGGIRTTASIPAETGAMVGGAARRSRARIATRRRPRTPRGGGS